ncbi:MAG: type VI secretion system tip protein TssI/VgrG [Polyangiaceae bacterium]
MNLASDVFEFQVRAGDPGAESFSRAHARIARFTGVERVSKPYRFDIVFLLERGGDDPVLSLLHARATFTMHLGATADESRRVHGVVEKVDLEGRSSDKHIELHVRLVPEIALLRATRRSRVYQQLTAPQVVEQVLTSAGIDVKVALSGTYATRDICIQYMESDLEFVERLLSEEGIYYAFDESGERERVVLCDDADRVPVVPHTKEALFRPLEGTTETRGEVTAFRSITRSAPKRLRLKEFDFERPSFALTAVAEDPSGDTRLEIYEHHGEHGGLDVRPSAATHRLEQVRRKATTATGASRIHDLSAGSSFTLAGAPRGEHDGQYTALMVEHVGHTPEIDASKSVYENRFACVPRVHAPRPRARRRRIQESLLTATIVGPAGQEIHTDQYGRVRVQFHWDREGKRNETSSCWVRAAQTWAGAGWGFQFIPRIGMEVLVAFIGGDLDRPLVVSAVPNAEHPVPFALPQSKSRSGIRTESTRGGNGFHEISFEDRKGYERLYVHAERDYDEDILRHRQTQIGGDLLLRVDGSSTSEIGGEELSVVKGSRITAIAEDETLTIAGSLRAHVDTDQTIEVGRNASLKVSGASTSTVTGSVTNEVGGALREITRGARHETIHGRRQVEARGGEILSVIGDAHRVVSGALNATAQSFSATVGREDNRVYVDVTKVGDVRLSGADEIVITARKSITLQVGKTTWTLDEDGIYADGKALELSAPRIELATDDASLLIEKKIEGSAQAIHFTSDSGGLIALDANASLSGAAIKLGSGDSADSKRREERKAEEKNVPKANVMLFDLRGEKCTGATYEVSVPGWTKTGTSSDGSVEVPLFADVELCRMKWGRPKDKREEGASDADFEFDMTIYLRTDGVPPEEKLRRQLSNLGHGHTDLGAAIAAFEAHKGLEHGSLPREGDLGRAASAVDDQHGSAEPAKKGGAS